MTLVFLLEDRSMATLLEALLPRLLPEDAGVTWRLIPHEGKTDLDKSIPRKLRAWQEPDVTFVVLRDQDSAPCEVLKARLVALCEEAGRPHTLVRIACRELEAWYLADLAAVDRVYGTKLDKQQSTKKYRSPDHLGSPSQELARLAPGFQKVGGARALGHELALDNPRSTSFGHFVRGVRRVAGVVSIPEEVDS